MGVPSFFRWLVKKYPGILERCVAVRDGGYVNATLRTTTETGEAAVPKLTMQHYPMDYDNLYLDMNGIIHNISHGNSLTDPTPSEEEMKAMLKEKLDQLVYLVRPSKLLYIALDGVAPRAKLNQQRGRRFKSAKDAKADVIIKQEKYALENPGAAPLVIEPWDSNQISPGTEFMEKVSEAIQQYIKDKMENDPLFKDIKIIFSDTSVPGEGEHKILDFIRQQRQQPNYNHATKHCFFGSDADLLFLGLSLHEPYFTVLREDDGTAYTKWKDMINAKPSNAVFVGRLPKYFTEDNLHTLASFFGTVDKHVLSKDVDGTTKGFGFVRFTEQSAATKMASINVRLNGEKALYIKYERPEELERQINRNILEDGPLDTVHVTNVPYTTTETELSKAMEIFGTVKEVRIITDGQARSKGYGYVRYETPESALKSEAVSGAHEVAGRKVKIEVSRRKRIPVVKDGVDVDAAIREFLERTSTIENGRAYHYLNGCGWDVEKAALTFHVGLPAPAPAPAPVPAAPAAAPSNSQTADNDDDNIATAEEEETGNATAEQNAPRPKELVFVHIHFLREYLKFEFDNDFKSKDEGVPDIAYDLEKVIDDFVLICMLCGNDFLPHIPMLDIRKGAVDLLLHIYKMLFQKLGGYLVEEGNIRFDRLSVFLQELSRVEGHFMIRRAIYLEERKKRDEAKAAASGARAPTEPLPEITSDVSDPYAPILPTNDLATWKQRYYAACFKTPIIDQGFMDKLGRDFVEGLMWVYKYYYFGVNNSSWGWYYPYHYAPLAGEVAALTEKASKIPPFEIGYPLKPLEQLMAILPPASSDLIPPAYRELMTSPTSPIIDFYPLEFEEEEEPGRPKWANIALLNFIDEKRLLDTLKPLEATLTEAQAQRNSFGHGLLFTPSSDPLLSTAGASSATISPVSIDAHVNIGGLVSASSASVVSSSSFKVLSFDDPPQEGPLMIGYIPASAPIHASVPTMMTADELSRCIPKRKKYHYLHQLVTSPSAYPGELVDIVDMTKSELLNGKKETPLGNLFSDDVNLTVQSDADEQLLINLQFKGAVKLTQLKIIAPATNGPTVAKLFANAQDMTFDDAEKAGQETHELRFNGESLSLNAPSIFLPSAKFSSLYSLAIFLPANLGSTDSTQIDRLVLYGQASAAMNLKSLPAKQPRGK